MNETLIAGLAKELVNPENLSHHRALVGQLIERINEIVAENELGQITAGVPETQLACGLATSPGESATCMEETLRTMKLMMAVYHACSNALENHDGDLPLRILYAGCGPLAPAVLAAALLLPPEQVKFVLMDVHEESIRVVKKITEELGIGDSIEECIVADAAAYRHEKEYDLNGLVVFSFNKGLFREPQLPVTANLAPQLSAPGVMIPEAIDFFGYVVNAEEELRSHSANGEKKEFAFNPEKAEETRISLGPVFRLNAANAAKVQKLIENNRSGKVLNMNLASFPVPQNRPPGKGMLMLSTIIIFYGPILLEEYESPLTFPTFFMHGQNLSEGSQVTFSYMMSELPGFVHRVD